MFSLIVATCFGGAFCFTDMPPIQYPTLERCFVQGAIHAGRSRASMGRFRLQQSTVIECTDSKGVTATLKLGRPQA